MVCGSVLAFLRFWLAGRRAESLHRFARLERLAGIIVDAGDLHGSAVGIDADGVAAIFESVLGLRGGGRQQQRGDSQKLLHYDLLSRESPAAKLRVGSVTQRDLDHVQKISLVLAALGSKGWVSLVRAAKAVNFSGRAHPVAISFEPRRIELLEGAILHRDVQPLVDESLQRDVALQPIGLFREIERLFRMYRAEHAGVKLLLVARLGRIRHHQVGIALGDLVEDRDVVVVDPDLRILDIGARKTLVGAAGIDDHARARLVDVGERLVLCPCRRSARSASCPRA